MLKTYSFKSNHKTIILEAIITDKSKNITCGQIFSFKVLS